jgi:hypothetical protein
LNDAQMCLLTVQLKALIPPPPKKNSKPGPRGHSPPSCSLQALAWRQLASQPALVGQLPNCGSRAEFPNNFQVSAHKVLKTSVPLPREGKGRGYINAGSWLGLYPEPVLHGCGPWPGRAGSCLLPLFLLFIHGDAPWAQSYHQEQASNH